MSGYTKLLSSHSISYPSMFKFPTQYPLVLAPMILPIPVACVSLILPPAPVSAPGYGATAHGKLCVSAVSKISQSRLAFTSLDGVPGTCGSSASTCPPRIADELSLNPITLFLLFLFHVSFTIPNKSSGIFSSSI